MPVQKPLWKTVLIIWSDYDPASTEIEDLARDATSGDAFCSSQEVTRVEDPVMDKDWSDTDFFNSDEDP